MKFLFLNAAIATFMPGVRVFADDRHVSPLDSTRLFPDADFRLDVDAATHSSDTSFSGLCDDLADGRVYGKASVFPAFIRKLQQATGKIVNLPKGYSFHFHDAQVQTLYLTESSPHHVDARMIEGTVPVDREDSDGSLIAFYVQESTADAYFQTDDDELCIPFVEGSAVYFNGGLPHNSIVKSGAVKLVGPFLLSSLESVGMILRTNYTYSQEEGDYMTYLSLTVEGKFHKLSTYCPGIQCLSTVLPPLFPTSKMLLISIKTMFYPSLNIRACHKLLPSIVLLLQRQRERKHPQSLEREDQVEERGRGGKAAEVKGSDGKGSGGRKRKRGHSKIK